MSRTGVAVFRPRRPVLSRKKEFVAAPAVMVKGTFAPVMSSIENLFAPGQASLAVSCQSLLGQEPVEVSSNLMRSLFSFNRIVSKPNDSLTTQSRPTQRLPWMISSSAVTTSSALTGALWSWTLAVPAVRDDSALFVDDFDAPPGSTSSEE